MCVLAGYVGSEPAAPILLKMMEKQEGLAGGFYSGVATVADGQLHYAKVVGDFGRLRRETDAERLPGNVGIAHSRTNSGGGREWGHPFVDGSGKLAYVANGGYGIFDDPASRNRMAQQLADAGHVFRSREPEPVGRYPVMEDGSCAHMSDVMCHLIAELMSQGDAPAVAMARAYGEFPSEIVGLMLHTDHPDCVTATRINQPLMLGRHRGDAFMASAALAFPEERMDWLAPMPVNATAVVRRGRIETHPFDTATGPVAEPIPWCEAEERIVAALAGEEMQSLSAPRKATADLWPQGQAAQSAMMLYEILRGLKLRGRIEMTDVQVPGAEPHLTAPQRHARIV